MTATSPGRCRPPQFDTLINAAGYPKLADYLHAKFPESIVAAIGEKNYAVHTMGGPGADMRITFGSRVADCDDEPGQLDDLTWRDPAGVNVPAYIDGPECNRFYVDADPDAGLRHAHDARRRGCTRSRATATSPGDGPRRAPRAATSG